MPTFTIIERITHYKEYEVEAETAEEARRAFVECGAGDEVDCHPDDHNGIIEVRPTEG